MVLINTRKLENMIAYTVKMTAAELRDWARNQQHRWGTTLKVSTYIKLRTEPEPVTTGHLVGLFTDRPKSIRGYNGARSRLGYGPV